MASAKNLTDFFRRAEVTAARDQAKREAELAEAKLTYVRGLHAEARGEPLPTGFDAAVNVLGHDVDQVRRDAEAVKKLLELRRRGEDREAAQAALVKAREDRRELTRAYDKAEREATRHVWHAEERVNRTVVADDIRRLVAENSHLFVDGDAAKLICETDASDG